MLQTIPSIVFAEISEKLSALQMFFGLFSIAFDRKSGSEAEKKPAKKKSSPKWDLLQENLEEGGGRKKVQHK